MADRKIPFIGSTETNPETKPFWDGCAAGKLVIPQCKDTGKYIWYPRAISPFTLGAVDWKEVSGNGTVYTYSVMERANPPYCIAYVQLTEGPKMMTNIVECPQTPEALQLDMPLEVVFEKQTDDITLPLFRPAKG